MKEIVVISGKGGTGKTSLTASFALLAPRAVFADADVDAANLHLCLAPSVREKHVFQNGYQASIDAARCAGCGACLRLCRFEAVKNTEGSFFIDATACEGCGVCARFCPQQAVRLEPRQCGVWMVSDTRAGPLVHAQLGIAAENAGKLVSLVRAEARRVAQESQRDMILIDGPPGTGCPVLASLTGASAALLVAEPTPSGEHDLQRVLALTRHFKVPAFVCVNKWDIAPDKADSIEALAVESGATLLSRVRYDQGVTEAQKQGKTIVETKTTSAADVEQLWKELVQQTEKEQES
jgi:MinD superfamily P-loop ATPase